ncbi:hypothetical protein ACKWRH_06145 [Bradyrhizobium sp. Pa8]|uniref:hypothetical protein n=1 Tax=Bradyrhizobium sp. Pa8 TaxID=3386552 RepID=UPI00403FADEA
MMKAFFPEPTIAKALMAGLTWKTHSPYRLEADVPHLEAKQVAIRWQQCFDALDG